MFEFRKMFDTSESDRPVVSIRMPKLQGVRTAEDIVGDLTRAANPKPKDLPPLAEEVTMELGWIRDHSPSVVREKSHEWFVKHYEELFDNFHGLGNECVDLSYTEKSTTRMLAELETSLKGFNSPTDGVQSPG